MIVVSGRNVNHVYPRGLAEVVQHGQRGDSRNGPVIVYPCPVTTVYERPTERVLFSETRDANPFFHLMESLWMLAGRRDAAFLTRYAKQIGEYAEPNGLIHGAYGWRWRHALGFDQLDRVAQRFRKNLDDRQCVIQMWDGMQEIERGSHEFPGSEDPSNYFGQDDLRVVVKDRPCNTHVYLRVRDINAKELKTFGVDPDPKNRNLDGSDYHLMNMKVLDLTVCCRSNDLIWGAYGANAVHFSVLQEYLAAAIGVGVGRMYQVSNNMHVYDNDLLRRCLDGVEDAETAVQDPYGDGRVVALPMVRSADTFLAECEQFCRDVDSLWDGVPRMEVVTRRNEWFSYVAMPVAMVHYYYKNGNMQAVHSWLRVIEASDWRLACEEWIKRRAVK